MRAPLPERTILVTGSQGFIGRHVVAHLRTTGADVREVPHRPPAGDLTAVAEGATDGIHLGWYAGPGDYLVNVDRNLESFDASVELVRALADAGCSHLVVVGSSAEYGPAPAAVAEDALIAPWSVYGALKASLHLVLRSSLLLPSMTLSWARPFNVVGPGEHEARLIPSVAAALMAGRPFELSAGEQLRDFIDVDDAAAAVAQLCLARASGTFNVSTGVATELRRFLLGLASRLGDSATLVFGRRPYGPNDPMVAVGRNERLLSATPWRRSHSIEDTLDRIAEVWR